MSKQTIWAIGGIAVLVIGIAMFFYIRERDNELKEEERSLRALESAVQEAGRIPNLDLPSANALNEVAPGINPIEEANPFKNVYENPFE